MEGIFCDVLRAIFPIGSPTKYACPRRLRVIFKKSPAASYGRRRTGVEERFGKWLPTSFPEFGFEKRHEIFSRIRNLYRVNYLLPAIWIRKVIWFLGRRGTSRDPAYFCRSSPRCWERPVANENATRNVAQQPTSKMERRPLNAKTLARMFPFIVMGASEKT